MSKKVWEQRFSQNLDPRVHRLNRSLDFDRRLYPYDIQGSLVWARALEQAGTLTGAELASILKGLEQVRAELDQDKFAFCDEDEDIHMAVERRLGEVIGEPAGKLHTGRSRNDQVATDLRLYASDHLGRIRRGLQAVITVLVDQADSHAATPFPGYTHLQQAQVLSLGHILLAHAWSLKADSDQLQDIAARTAVCPLGSAALGGSSAPVDRAWIARELGFERPSENSVEAVSSRDFVLDALYGLARLGVHLSRLGEDFILWNTQEFGFVALDDAVATGSSLLAHKKNPDVFELIRGKAGRLAGHLSGFLNTMKGLPSGYNKDLQEDKEPLFDAVDTLLNLLPALEATLKGAAFRPDAVNARLTSFLKAGRIVDYLTDQSVPFREAYGVAGSLVKTAESRGEALDQLSMDTFKAAHNAFDDDIAPILSAEWKVPETGIQGGSNQASVKAQVKALREWLGEG